MSQLDARNVYLDGRDQTFRASLRVDLEDMVVKRQDAKYKSEQTLWYKSLNPR
jgi:hypothetical protein